MFRGRFLPCLFGLGSAILAGPALAQQSPLLLHPVAQTDEVPPGAVLIPPAVFGGSANGLSGYGYYYDGPGEGPLLVPPGPSTRSARRRAR